VQGVVELLEERIVNGEARSSLPGKAFERLGSLIGVNEHEDDAIWKLG
jgi:hypothetical protein